MHLQGTELELSATDLANFLGCRHRTALDLGVARGRERRPPRVPDPLLELLFRRGLEHERLYVQKLRSEGCEIVDLSDQTLDNRDGHVTITLAAMRAGADVIVQGALRDGPWFGKPDILRRVDQPGALGGWSYEVADTKLARETRAGTMLQLGLYSEMLARVQGVVPAFFHVVTPYSEHRYRVSDYAAYVRMVRTRMVEATARDPRELVTLHYPEPVEHCQVCHWAARCARQRREDDHLSLVAGISRLHRRELEAAGIRTLEQLASLPLPFPETFRPTRGSRDTFVRVREQARVQLQSRSTTVPVYELRELDQGRVEGLCRLPEPSVGDVFLDIEGDPFAAEGGREYLVGLATLEEGRPRYRAWWAFTAGEERIAFEEVMDFLMAAWQRDPGMHVYHYGHYEPSTFKRLMGRHATRGEELDALLRSERFVDLYAVVRQGLRVGTERYSIKNLESLYAFVRTVQLADANKCRRVMEQALEMRAPHTVPDEIREAVRGYNEDDCVSALRLRDWLERVRDEAIAGGAHIPRSAGAAAEVRPPTEQDLKVEALRARLLTGVPEEREARDDEQQARWLLAYMLDYHRREDKATWWEYFRLRDLPEEDLYDEPQAIAGLEFVERVRAEVLTPVRRTPTGRVVDRYRYPPQEMDIERGELKMKDGIYGEIVTLDRFARTVDIRVRKEHVDRHPTALFAHTYISPKAISESLFRIGEAVADGGLGGAGVAGALLLGSPPRVHGGTCRSPGVGEPVTDHLVRTVLALHHSVLCVQGPPGAGKTYNGAEMICALVTQGRRVGIAANSHKVVLNLLQAVSEAAVRHGVGIPLGHRGDEHEEHATANLQFFGANDAAAEAMRNGDVQVLGGTAWLWSREELHGAVDVLFVDEAGQAALANVVAMAPCCDSLVLLGDPCQLEQPRQGSHPNGVGASALDHMLNGERTIPDDLGVFLPETWRMHPRITAYTSEMFYESRLLSRPGLEVQRLDGSDEYAGAGLWLVQTAHDGNRTSSPQEIDLIRGIAERLLGGAEWTNTGGTRARLGPDDILVVAPYNAQVSRLDERLRDLGVRVGTVDRFQGQEAPVVIYSMTTSRPEDAPRGMEFLYSLNRLNVATSRARCAAIVVANGPLLEPECHTPAQMKLANALCRYREVAT